MEPQPITIQIQLEPNAQLSDKALGECRAAMYEAVHQIEYLGYVRCQMCIGLNAYME